jgi:hypothetical protein
VNALVIIGAGLLLFAAQTPQRPGRPAQLVYPPPITEGSSAIRGRIVDAQTNEPLSGVSVRILSGRPAAGRTTTTDDAGAYEFAAIAEGNYSLTIESSTHLPPSGYSRVTVDRDQRVGLDLRLVRGAVARGQVVDSHGKPVVGATVRLGMPLRDSPSVPIRPVVTRNDGLFELAPLPSGEWRLEVDLTLPRDLMRLPIVYYPGVVSPEEAAAIELTAGLVTDNITVVVPPIGDHPLTLRVSALAALSKVEARVIRASPLMIRRVDLDAEGVGTIRGLLEGRYFATARQWSESQVLVAFQVVDFAPHSPDIRLTLERAGRVKGRIVAERGGLPPVTGVRVGASWIHDDVEIDPLVPDQVEVAPDGTFQIDGLFGVRRLELIALPADWRVQSILRGRFDVANGVDVPPASNVDVTIVVARR